jgi:hypothetical protein
MASRANALSSLVDWLVPDQLEAMVSELSDFAASPVSVDLRGDLWRLLDRFGDGVKPALYEFLCDAKGRSRSAASRALKHSVEAGVALLVPILVKDFKLDAMAAAGVATLVVKALASRGQDKLCEELSTSAKPKKKPKRKQSPRRGVRKTTTTRKRKPTKKRR